MKKGAATGSISQIETLFRLSPAADSSQPTYWKKYNLKGWPARNIVIHGFTVVWCIRYGIQFNWLWYEWWWFREQNLLASCSSLKEDEDIYQGWHFFSFLDLQLTIQT